VLAPEVIWRNLLLYAFLHTRILAITLFDIHEFLRLRCRYPRERSVPLRERLAREQQSNPSPREAPLSGYINYDSEPSGCNNKLDELSDRTDRFRHLGRQTSSKSHLFLPICLFSSNFFAKIVKSQHPDHDSHYSHCI